MTPPDTRAEDVWVWCGFVGTWKSLPFLYLMEMHFQKLTSAHPSANQQLQHLPALALMFTNWTCNCLQMLPSGVSRLTLHCLFFSLRWNFQSFRVIVTAHDLKTVPEALPVLPWSKHKLFRSTFNHNLHYFRISLTPRLVWHILCNSMNSKALRVFVAMKKCHNKNILMTAKTTLNAWLMTRLMAFNDDEITRRVCYKDETLADILWEPCQKYTPSINEDWHWRHSEGNITQRLFSSTQQWRQRTSWGLSIMVAEVRVQTQPAQGQRAEFAEVWVTPIMKGGIWWQRKSH